MSFFVKKELPSDFLKKSVKWRKYVVSYKQMIFNGMVGKMLEKWLKIVIYRDQ